MRVSEELYEVIKSLSPGENRMVIAGLSPRRMELYRIYQNLEKHDLNSIKQQFSHTTTQHIAAFKRQLFDKILEILWHGYPKNGIRKVQDYLGEVEILAQKGLYDVAHSRINDAIEDAFRFELMPELLSGIELKRRILEIAPIKDVHHDRDLAWYQFAVNGISEIAKVEMVHSLAMLARTCPISERAAQIERISNKLKELGEFSLGRAKIKYFRTRYIVHRLQGDHSACAEDCRAVLHVIDQQLDLMNDPGIRQEFFSNLHYEIVSLTTQHEYDSADKSLRKFALNAKKWIGEIESDHMLYSRYTFSLLVISLYRKNYDKAKQIVKDVVAAICTPQNRFMLRYKPRWLRFVLKAQFLFQDYRSVRQFAAEIKANTPQNHNDPAFYAGVMLFSLFSMYEQQDEFLPKAIESAYSYLRDVGGLEDYMVVVLDFLGKSCKERNANNNPSLLVELEYQLNQIFQNPLQWQSRDSFPIMEWIESKRTGKPLTELMFR